MSLKARLGNAVQKRVEGMPSVREAMARSERVRPIDSAARRAANSTLDDEAAMATLRAQLNADPAVVKEATLSLSRRRDNYISDRAYRLLSAAAASSAVQPVPPARADLFAAEEALGRMSLEEAFERLSKSEPRLDEIRRRVNSQSAGIEHAECAALRPETKEELAELVGGSARRDDELLRTSLASSIVAQYLQLLAGDARSGPATASYFDHSRKAFWATGGFWGGRHRQYER